jgi:hypothetical protein
MLQRSLETTVSQSSASSTWVEVVAPEVSYIGYCGRESFDSGHEDAKGPASGVVKRRGVRLFSGESCPGTVYVW